MDSEDNKLGREKTYITKMCFHNIRLFVFSGFFLCLIQFLDKRHRLACQTPVKLTAHAGCEKGQKFHGLHRKKRIEVHSTECELLEGTLLPLNWGFTGIRHRQRLVSKRCPKTLARNHSNNRHNLGEMGVLRPEKIQIGRETKKNPTDAVASRNYYYHPAVATFGVVRPIR